MKNTLENIIYITIFIILCFPQNVSAKKYLGNDVTYKEVTNYKGNVDLIQSAHAGILVEAYRLMNGLGMPDSKDRMEYNNYKNFYGGKEWKKRVEGILDIDTGDRWYGCVSKFAMILLDERIRKLGLSHPYIKSWLREQETVFSNCFYKNPLQLPNAFQINSDDSRELRNLKKYDHQYQLASSYFYAKQFNVAVDEYNKIIKEQASQYYATAHYMIARSLLNDRKYDAAYNKLKSIIADNRLKQIHQDARDLIGVVADRSSNENYEEEQLKQILSPLLKKIETDEDKKLLKDKFNNLNYDLWFYLSFHGTDSPGVKKLAPNIDILDWLLTFTVQGAHVRNTHWADKLTLDECKKNYYCDYEESVRTLNHSIEKWYETKRMHWLIAVMFRLPQGHSFQNKALAIFKKLHNKVQNNQASDEELYAYPTIAHHAIRLLINDKKYDEVESIIYPALEYQKEFAPRVAFHAAKFWLSIGEYDRAEELIDKAIEQEGFLDVSSFYKLKRILVKNLDELLFIGSKLTKNNYNYRSRANFDIPVAAVLDLMPVSKLVELSENDIFNDKAKTDLKLVAWTRAILLNKYDIANQLALSLEKEIPELSSYFRRYLDAEDNTERHRAALSLFLKNPRVHPYLNINDYDGRYLAQDKIVLTKFEAIDIVNHSDNNWWCEFNPQERLLKAGEQIFDNVMLTGRISNMRNLFRRGRYGELILNNEHLVTKRNELAANYPPLQLIDHNELEALWSLGHATTYLPAETVKWANDTSIISRYLNRNPLLPELLHRAVKVTRYGCSKDDGKGVYSREAFKILYKDYWFSGWKDKTPYWFE